MKSLSPVPPPPLVLGRESEVLPKPLDPSAEELELEELDEDEDEEDELELDELLRRLVAAVNAEVALGAELDEEGVDDPEPDELDEELLDEEELPPPELDESRPNPVRLPMRRGVMSEAYWAAAVTPVRRNVRSTGPETTMAVRIAEGPPGPPPDVAVGRLRSHRVTPPATIRRRTINTSDRRNPLDFFARGGTTSGRMAGCRGASPGSGRALI
jgi:hypothetical protein